MENKNGSGIFLGVVGVATLVVAIIGATFAYFNARIEGDNEVEAEAYVFASSLSVSEISGTQGLVSNGLIPMADTMVDTAVNKGVTDGTPSTTMCVDNQGYDACQIYELEFTNNGSATVIFDGVLTIATDGNGFQAEHLQLVEFGANKDGGQVLG